MSATVNYAFLHGGGQGSWVWQETADALLLQQGENPCKILTLDAPGCGNKRQRNTEKISFDQIVEELINDIDAAGLTEVALIGHSQAGTVMPAMAARRPDLFRRLIYISCSIPLPGQTIIQMMGNSIHGSVETEVGWPADPETTPLRERTEIMLCNDMSEPESAAFMARLGGDQWPQASYTETNWQFGNMGEVPSTYVLCLQDNILPVRWQEVFADRFRTEKIVRIDAGHQAMTTRPNTLAEVLRHEM